MKKTLLLAAVLLAGFFCFSLLNAQQNPFDAKKRTITEGKAVSPEMPLPVPDATFLTKQSRSLVTSSYQPSQVNLSAIYLDRAIFSGEKFDKNGQLIFLEGQVPDAIQLSPRSEESVQAACYQYLEAIRQVMRINEPLQEFRVKTIETDALGMTHVKMQQHFMDIPVWCAEVVLHSRNNTIDLFNGNFYPTPMIHSVEPVIGNETAIASVIEHISGQTAYYDLSEAQQELLEYDSPFSELMIYHKDRNPFSAMLAWHISIRPNFIEIWEYFVDASTGEIIHFYNNTRRDGDVPASGVDLNGVTRNFRAYLEGGVYYLVDASKPMFNPQTLDGILAVFDAQNTNPGNQNFAASLVTSNNNMWSPTAVSAMYNANMSYEYFRNTHNRNSFNNQGAALKSIIHVGNETGGGFDNAFWNGAAVFYGDGQVAFKPLAGALDVGAHEFGHAFESAASNLEYQYQSGAIAESYADYSGAMTERQNWLIGEQIVKPAYFPSGALRDMSNPHNGGTSLSDPGYQPAHVNEMYTGNDDNGGVHINSGIGNLAFYKTAQAIGIEKTEKIFWHACFNYLTRSTQFIDFRLNVIQSAKDLHGNNSPEVNAVAAGFDFVGITDGQGGNYQNELPVNPGQDKILLYDMVSQDPNTLYTSSTAGTNFVPISQTQLNNKPSLVDNGSYALFVSNDAIIKSISLTSPYNEIIVQDEAIWHNVAISKDGGMVSAITNYQDSAIWVYSYALQQWAKFHLYNATTAQGQETHTVIYADAMEWDYSGEYIIYDALSRIENPSGQAIEWWDINFIKVWDKAGNNWGSGDIFKVFGSLPAGLSVGNPSFAKNSPYIFAFDIYEPASNTIVVAAANFENGNVGEIFTIEGVLGTPNYSKMDDFLIFTVPGDFEDDIAIIEMQPDKITPKTQNANKLITEAMWGIWFSQGERPLDIAELSPGARVRVYPNPTKGRLNLAFDGEPGGLVHLKVFDTRGAVVYTMGPVKADNLVMDLTGLPEGVYILQVAGERAMMHQKIIIGDSGL